jgi:hypothetical protein
MGKFDAAPDRPEFIRPEDQERALTNPDGTRKRDLRSSSHEDLGVEVRRKMLADGHLARGDATRFSRLEFRSVGRARPKGDDPVFTGRGTADEDAPTAADAPAAEHDPPKPKPGWIGRLFGQK